MTDPTRTFLPLSVAGRSDADLVLDLAAGYHAAKEAGKRLDLAEVCRQRPDLLSRVRELLGLGDDLHALAGQPPDTLGRYAVLGPLGSGGMGDVFRATDTAFGREVALKVLQPKFGPASAAARRFADEARITGQLQHPNIPAVHDLGTLPDGRPFLAMKLVKGDTLDDLLKARPSPSAERGKFLAVFEQVCHAVAYAHARNVIHRDLKPHNVMVGAFGEVQVMDWGLAKVLVSPLREQGAGGEGESGETVTAIQSLRDSDGEFTHAGSVLGTPAYISPEQAIGAVDQIDRQSDVFGIGGILCAILTGKPPFVGDTAESTRQLAAKGKLADAFARLDASGAEPDLVALCKRCLAAEKSDRPADADVVAKAVAELRAAADERARRAELDRVTAELQLAEQKRRRRMQAVFAAVVLLLVAAIGVGLWRYDRQMRDNEFERQQLAQQSRFEKLQIVTDAVARLEQLRDQCRERGEYAQTKSQAEEIKAGWDRAAFALEQASSLLSLPEAADSSVASRIEHLRVGIAFGVVQAKPRVERIMQSRREIDLAKHKAIDGEPAEAVERTQKALAAYPHSVEALMLHGDLSCRLGQFEAALRSYNAARPLVEKYTPALSQDIDIRVSRTNYYVGAGAQLAKSWDGKSPSNPSGACELAELFLVTGHYEQAVTLFSSAFESDPKLLPVHRFTAAWAATLGGSGFGVSHAKGFPGEKRREMRAKAIEWLPRFDIEFLDQGATLQQFPLGRVSMDTGSNVRVSHLKSVNGARHRFIRSVLPSLAKSGDWTETKVDTHGTQTKIPAYAFDGTPYPGKTALNGVTFADKNEEREIREFVSRISGVHLLYDYTCCCYEVWPVWYQLFLVSIQLS